MSLRFLVSLLVLLGVASTASAAERRYTVTDFTRVRVDGGYGVKVTTGVSPFATASGTPAALDAVSVEVQGQTLIVRQNRSAWGGFPGQRPGPVEINVGTHDITAAWLNGAGSVAVDKVRGLSFQLSVQGSGSGSVANLSVDKLETDLSGSGTISLAGRAKNVHASVRGPGLFDAANLSAKDVNVSAEGDSVLKITATETAKVFATGTASVELAGKPACTVDSNGAATVSGCR
jgi:hypothetical protein